MKRLTTLLLLAVFVANIGILLLPTNAQAIDRVGPSGHMSYLVSRDAFANVNTTYVNIYSKNPSIDVFITSADLCDGDFHIDGQKDLVKGDGQSTYLGDGRNDNPANGREVTKFTLNGQIQHGERKGDTSCNRNDGNEPKTHAPAPNAARAGMTLAATTRVISTTSSTKLAGSTDVYIHTLEATVPSGLLAGCAANCMVNLFKVIALNPGNGSHWGSGDNIWVTQPPGDVVSGSICGGPATCRIGDVNVAQVGVQASISPGWDEDSYYTNIEAEFAPDCTFPSDGKVSMLLYDDDNRPDNGAQKGKQFKVRLETLERRNDNNYNWDSATVVDVGLGNINSNSNYPSNGSGIGLPNFSKSKNDFGWLFMGNVNSKKYITVDFRMNKNNVYRMRINDIYRGNIIQYTLPFSSVWADDSVWRTRTCADWHVSGTTTVDKSTVEVGDPAQFTHAIRNNGTDPAPFPIPYAVHQELRELDGTHIAYLPPTGIAGGWTPALEAGQNYAIPNSPAFRYIGQSAHVGKLICQKLYIANHRPNSTDWSTSEKCVEVKEQFFEPYFRVWGGDVEAGFGPGLEACINDTAQIAGWNLGGPSSTSVHPGSGTQFGAQAMSVIRGFASAQAVPSLSPSGVSYPTNGTGLTFANDSRVGADVYGGNFNATPNCKDYTTGLTVTDNGDKTIGTTNIAIGSQVVKYVKDGDVHINGDGIKYRDGEFNLSTMPSFKLVVEGGNIYINKSVTQLDGVYIAQKNAAGVGGKIFTCTEVETPVAQNRALAECNRQLTINGSFIADKVMLMRTFGDLGSLVPDGSRSSDPDTVDSNNAAERFIYTPEVWLNQSTTTRVNKPDAIISLPPVL